MVTIRKINQIFQLTGLIKLLRPLSFSRFFDYWSQLTGRLPKFYFTSASLNCVRQNRQCHQIMTIYFSSSRVYRSFTGKRQHFAIWNAGDFIEPGVQLHFLYYLLWSSRAPFPPVELPAAVLRTKLYQHAIYYALQ